MLFMDTCTLANVGNVATATRATYPQFHETTSPHVFFEAATSTIEIQGAGKVRMAKPHEVFTTSVQGQEFPVYARIRMRDGRSFDWATPCALAYHGDTFLGLTTCVTAYANNVIGSFGLLTVDQAYERGLPRMATLHNLGCMKFVWGHGAGPDAGKLQKPETCYVGQSPLACLTVRRECPNCELYYGDPTVLFDKTTVPIILVAKNHLLPGTPLTYDDTAPVKGWSHRRIRRQGITDTPQGPYAQTHDRLEVCANKRHVEIYDMGATILRLHKSKMYAPPGARFAIDEQLTIAEQALATALAEPLCKGAGGLYRYDYPCAYPEIAVVSPLANPWFLDPLIVPSPIGKGTDDPVRFSASACTTDNVHEKSPLTPIIHQFVTQVMTPPIDIPNPPKLIRTSRGCAPPLPALDDVDDVVDAVDQVPPRFVYDRSKRQEGDGVKDVFLLKMQAAAAAAMAAAPCPAGFVPGVTGDDTPVRPPMDVDTVLDF